MVVNRHRNVNDSQFSHELFSSSTSCVTMSGGTAGGTANMTEEVLKAAGALSGPGADCNSNHTNNGETTGSYLSNTSSHHDIDFIQDNSDDQWFLDYGYRDSLHHHVSVLCGIESGLYDDLAVAEVDMEHFQIRSLLHTLPAMCRADLQSGNDSNHQGEMFASVTGSMMAQFEFESSISPHSSSQGEDSAGSTDAMSLCKSELLFSPVKECPLPGTINFSVDSLDSDIMLTCQANKNNYTIAFEGSTTMCSEDSDYQENVESDTASSEGNNWSHCTKVMNPQVAAVKSERRTILNTSLGSTGESGGTPSKGSPGGRHLAAGMGNMARSDSVFTTWSKLNGTKTEHPLDTQQLSRHPSGNNNTKIENGEVDPAADNARITEDNTDSTTVKSRSLPNLARQQQLRRCLVNKTNAGSTSVSSVESMCVKLYDVQNNSSPLTSSGASSSSSGGRLVRLFMKQRSGSSIASDCWDSDSCVRSTSFVGRKANRNVNRSTGPVCNTVYQSCPGGRDMAALCAESEKPDKKELFEDSLYREDGSGDRSHDQIVEEDGASESVERISESLSNVHSCDYSSNYSSHHGLPGSRERVPPDGEAACHCNVNNNNSVEGSRRESRGSICSCNSCSCGSGRCAVHRNSGTQAPVPLISRSIQTSCILDVISKNAMSEEEENAKEKAEKEEGEKAPNEEKQSKPVYVFYPNYALPDLGFLREKQQIDLTKVYLKPQKFAPAAVTQDLMSKIPACLRQPVSNKQKRPFSCNDIEDLRKKGFGHVRDWNSLAMLLPDEYRQYLAEIPEVSEQLDGKDLPDGQPLFCVSPPKSRSNPCECNMSSASSTNTQPSSGYRGSSTLLSDSSSPAPNFNPMFVYRYDSISSEASLNQNDKKRSGQVPQLPKRSISLPASGKGAKRVPVEVPPPPRPPLPKGILRHPSEDPVNPKLRKETNNKRYSMFEMGLTELESGRRASHHDASSGRIRTRSRSEDGLGDTTTEEDEGVDASSERYVHRRPCCDHANFEEVLRLSDFLHISETGLSDGSADEWDQDKMNKLRVQVSRFLSANGCEVTEECRSNCVGTCHCERKVVTFNTGTENGKEKLKTPPNSPNMSAPHINDHRQFQCKLQPQAPLSDLPIREEESCEISTASACSAKSPVDMKQKKELVSAVSDAVEKVINHFSSAATLNECTRLGDSASSPAVAEVVLGWLCPALYAVLSDGLLPSISSAFGDIGNSVWQVVEASAQQGPMTRSLNELVLRLNSEDVFAEGLLKFNAFIFGLLNVHSMDAWMAYLRTRESIIRKHYSPESLLVLSSSGGPQYRALTDRLLAALRPLSLLPFKLDLLFECRQLHQSLQRLSQPAASPSALIRLVRSIQNSVGQMPSTQEEANFVRKNSVGNGISTDGGEQPAPILRRVSRSGAVRQLRRPRSCVEPAEINRNEPNNIMCKRWSGVQLGSKLSLALDRLMAEDTEEEYTDSIEREAHPNRKRISHQSDNSTSDDPETLVSMENISDAEIDTDSSERKIASDGSSEGAHRPQRKTALGVGGKFRRLQMKWELLTGSGSESRNGSTRTSPETSPIKSVRPRVPSNSTVTSPAASPIKSSSSRSSLNGGASPSGSSTASSSRIPRPITSPVRPPSGIPVLSNTSKKLVSPTQQPSGLPHATQMKRPTSTSVRASRLDQPTPPGEQRSPAMRPSSLPYSPATHSPLDKNKKSTPQRRATSASVSRTAKPSTKTTKPAQRLVRSVKHQLASDSGHLSFSAGERLVLVLEVDEQWLLCRKGDRMGLVRRSAVVATQDHLAGF